LTGLNKRAAKTEQTTVRRFFSEVALSWLAHYGGGGGGVVTESLPKAPSWHPKVMLMTLEAHYRSTGFEKRWRTTTTSVRGV